MQRSVAGWMACESSYYSVAFAAKSPVRPPPPKHTPTMSVSSNAPTTRLYSPFLHSYSSALPKHFLPSPSSSHKRNRRLSTAYPIIKALDLDQNTLVAISVGAVSVAVGIGIPIFYETQIDNAVSAHFSVADRLIEKNGFLFISCYERTYCEFSYTGSIHGCPSGPRGKSRLYFGRLLSALGASWMNLNLKDAS
ncbi:hypothetical protein ACLOJK_001084 [Asimina triloba]